MQVDRLENKTFKNKFSHELKFVPPSSQAELRQDRGGPRDRYNPDELCQETQLSMVVNNVSINNPFSDDSLLLNGVPVEGRIRAEGYVIETVVGDPFFAYSKKLNGKVVAPIARQIYIEKTGEILGVQRTYWLAEKGEDGRHPALLSNFCLNHKDNIVQLVFRGLGP